MAQGKLFFRLRRVLGPVLGRIGFLVSAAAIIVAWQSPGAQAETITVTHWGGQFYGVPYAVAMEKGDRKSVV